MSKDNEHFNPENIEEQIEHMLEESQNTSRETRLVHMLQAVTAYDTTEEDRVSLQRTRERILSRKSSHDWVEIIPLPEERSQSHYERYSEGERPKRKKSFLHLINAVAAVLVVGLAVGSWMTITRIVNQQENIPIFSQGVQQQNVYALEQDALSKLDGPTGKVIWRHQISESLSSGWIFVEKDDIIYTSGNYEVSAFRASTGEVLWHYKVDANKFPKTTEPLYHVGSLSDEKRIYLQYSTGMIALDLKNGRELWQQYSSELWSDQSSSTYLLEAKNDQLYISQENQIYALDSANGNIQWGITFPFDSANYTIGGLQVIEGIVYFSVNNTLYALREQDGQEVWKYDGDKQNMIYLYPWSGQDMIYLYIGDREGNAYELRALDAKSGNTRWVASPNLKFFPFGLPNNPTTDGLLLAFGVDNTGKNANPRLYALDTKDGKIHWRGEICACESAWTRITDDAFYLADGKTFTIYELSTGEIRYQQKFEWSGMLEENNGIAYLQAPHRFYAVRIADNTLLWEYKIDQYGTSGNGTPTFLIAP